MYNLYYTNYQQFHSALMDGQLIKSPQGDYPEQYAQPDAGFLFRFPFPDENRRSIGDYDDFDRGVPIKVPASILHTHHRGKEPLADLITLEIIQQELIHRPQDKKRCLALVVREPRSGKKFRIDRDELVVDIVKGIIHNHIAVESDAAKKNFYRKIAAIILKGYRLTPPDIKQSAQIKAAETKPNKLSPQTKMGLRKRKI